MFTKFKFLFLQPNREIFAVGQLKEFGIFAGSIEAIVLFFATCCEITTYHGMVKKR